MSDLEQWVLSQRQLRDGLQQVLRRSLASHFNGFSLSDEDVPDWTYLLNAASVLAQFTSESAQATALRITQQCMRDPSAGDPQKIAAALILDSLGNRVAVRLAEQRGYIGGHLESSLGALGLVEWTRNTVEAAVPDEAGEPLLLNRFQRRAWTAIRNSDWVSLSAPTSSGKSFVITKWLVAFLRGKQRGSVAFVVPTRALVSQVETDVRKELATAQLEASVSSLPLASAVRPDRPNIWVFTQERLHLFMLATSFQHQIGAVIVDEAHKVGDGTRGILLQHVLERVSVVSPEAKLVFASPLSENPQALLADAPPRRKTEAVPSDDVVVNQNLYWASQVRGKPKEWKLERLDAGEPVDVGTARLPHSPAQVTKRLPFVAHALGRNSHGNLVYSNGAADAEKMSLQLADLEPEATGDDRSSLDQLAELVRHAVHPQYSLAEVLRNRVAFHYGNMPLIVRSAVERLFRQNVVRFLVATSTLIEGVNLSCRNVFLRGPTKGRNRPMQAQDFWNLAGRAGRWGVEFEGNVVCVDARREDTWKAGAPRARARFQIVRQADQLLADADTVSAFIEADSPRDRAKTAPGLDYVVSLLVGAHVAYGSVTESPWWSRVPATSRRRLQAAVSSVVESEVVPVSLIERNPGVSPFAMRDLLSYFRDRDVPSEEFLPVPAESDDAVDCYTRIFKRVGNTLGLGFEGARHAFVIALVVVKWMRGFPLPRIINDRLRYQKKQGKGLNLAGLIRETMSDIENYARFAAPRALNAYSDVLRLYLESNGEQAIAAELPDLNVMLEFGVSQATQVSLMGLGFSRTTTLAVSELIAADDLDEAAVIRWIQRHRSRLTNLPRLVQAEVEERLHILEKSA